jgi:hypothetical protein
MSQDVFMWISSLLACFIVVLAILVYIDNIYDPRVGMNDYGIPEKITQMGHLVYKPEDYESQVRLGVPEKYLGKRTAGGYVDISALWEKIPVIKNFKEELKKRGVLK